MEDTTGTPDSTETIAGGIPHAAEGRRGPTWRGWVLSIIAAVLLSVTATLLLGAPACSGRILRSRRQWATVDPGPEAIAAHERTRGSERQGVARILIDR
jgi:hypothetical protein